MNRTIPTAEPFFFPGKGKKARIGCLVQHGFTGAPKEMRWLGEYLNEQGYTVCGMRLNGHATQPADMIRCHWEDWLMTVEDGYNLLKACCDQVFLLGLSMGGALSLLWASQKPVQGVVTMSTPSELPHHPLLPFARPLSLFVHYIPKGKGEPGADWFDKKSFAQHVAYPKNPVRSAAELIELLGVMRANLPQVTAPALLIHSRDDHYVGSNSMDYIYNHIASKDKQEMWVEGGGHVITEEPTRHQVFKAAGEFVRRVSGV